MSEITQLQGELDGERQKVASSTEEIAGLRQDLHDAAEKISGYLAELATTYIEVALEEQQRTSADNQVCFCRMI
jgi:chromosome segregation ATPase